MAKQPKKQRRPATEIAMRVPKTVLKHLVMIAGDYPILGGTDGVRLRRIGTEHTAVATDGMMLIQVSWFDATGRGAPNFEATLSSEALENYDEGKDQFLDVTRDENGGTVTVTSTNSIDVLDEKFPDTDSVIPDYSPDKCHVFTVDPKRFAKLLLSVVNALPPSLTPVIITCPLDARKAIRIDANSGGLSVVAALAPVKNEGTK